MCHYVLTCSTWLVVAFVASFADGAEPLVFGGPTMGTTYHVKLRDGAASDEFGLRSDIDAILIDVDRRLSTYRADSEISHFNRAPPGEWLAVSPATAEIASAAKQFATESGGALDVTVGPLVRLWHFGPDAIAKTKTLADLKLPDEADLQAARAVVGHEKLDVRLDPPALRKQVAGLEIDLSSIGEGYAIDQIAQLLSDRGYEDFLVELGGEVRASGRGPQGRPWRVAVQRPTDSAPQAQAFVELNDAAIATSGDYHRYFEHDGRRYSHIIDPATFRPIDHKLAAVTVAADRALTADVWDTALLVLGPELGYQCAVEHGLAALLISREGDGFVTRETPAWKKRFATATSSSAADRRTRSP